jgi:hypothetical protein
LNYEYRQSDKTGDADCDRHKEQLAHQRSLRTPLYFFFAGVRFFTAPLRALSPVGLFTAMATS